MLFSNELLWIFSLIFLIPGLFCCAFCLKCLKRGRLLAAVNRAILGLFLLASAGTLAGIQTGMQGYRQLLKEEAILQIETFPISKQRFSALVTWPDGEEKAYYLYGDQLYIDAQILKWTTSANLLGLGTYYELDRIGGRYINLADEQEKPRSLHSLKTKKQPDIYHLIEQSPWLKPLVDTAYGSATFIDVQEPSVWELKVSTTGLLVRKLNN